MSQSSTCALSHSSLPECSQFLLVRTELKQLEQARQKHREAARGAWHVRNAVAAPPAGESAPDTIETDGAAEEPDPETTTAE